MLFTFLLKIFGINIEEILNEVTSKTFGVNIIPHTRNETNFRNLKESELVNLEIDILARYLSGIVTKSK